jgi:hypothetical protein
LEEAEKAEKEEKEQKASSSSPQTMYDTTHMSHVFTHERKHDLLTQTQTQNERKYLFVYREQKDSERERIQCRFTHEHTEHVHGGWTQPKRPIHTHTPYVSTNERDTCFLSNAFEPLANENAQKPQGDTKNRQHEQNQREKLHKKHNTLKENRQLQHAQKHNQQHTLRGYC